MSKRGWTKAKKETRIWEAHTLSLQGFGITEIAQKLDVTPNTISRDLAEVNVFLVEYRAQCAFANMARAIAKREYLLKLSLDDREAIRPEHAASGKEEAAMWQARAGAVANAGKQLDAIEDLQGLRKGITPLEEGQSSLLSGNTNIGVLQVQFGAGPVRTLRSIEDVKALPLHELEALAAAEIVEEE